MQPLFRRPLLALVLTAGSCWATTASGAPIGSEIPSLRAFERQTGRFSIGAHYTTSILPKLTEGKGIAVSAHYGLLRRLKVGLQGVYLSSSNTSVLQAIYRQGVDPANPSFGDPLGSLYHLHWLIGANAEFTPLSAQLHLTKGSALNFEFFIPMGGSIGHLRRPQIGVDATGEFVVESWIGSFRPVFNFGLGGRAYITPWLALSAEFRQYLFSEPLAGIGGLNYRPYLQFGLHLSWGTEAQFPESLAPAEMPAFTAQRIEVSAQFSAGFYDRFTDSFGFSGAIGYHLFEHWQLEAFGTKLFTTLSDVAFSAVRRYSLQSNVAQQSELLWAAGATLQLIPFTGRLNVLDHTLAVSPYVGVGFGLGAIRVPCDAGMSIDPEVFGDGALCPLIPADADANYVTYEPDRLRPVGVLAGGLRVRLAEHFALRIEIKDYIHVVRVFRPDVNDNDQLQSRVRHVWMSQVGLSVLFGGA